LDFLIPPGLAKEELELIRRWLRLIFVVAIGLLIVYGLVAFYQKFPQDVSIFTSVFLAIYIGLLLLLQRGHTRLVSLLFCLSTLGLMLYATYRFGGVRSPAYTASIVIIILAGVFLRGRMTVLTTGVIVLSGLFLLILELEGIYQPDTFYLTPFNSWFSDVLIFVMVAIMLGMAVRRLRASLRQAAT